MNLFWRLLCGLGLFMIGIYLGQAGYLKLHWLPAGEPDKGIIWEIGSSTPVSQKQTPESELAPMFKLEWVNTFNEWDKLKVKVIGGMDKEAIGKLETDVKKCRGVATFYSQDWAFNIYTAEGWRRSDCEACIMAALRKAAQR